MGSGGKLGTRIGYIGMRGTERGYGGTRCLHVVSNVLPAKLEAVGTPQGRYQRSAEGDREGVYGLAPRRCFSFSLSLPP
eukprot:2278500-Rhodomonas_salina.1